jgi:hypothetical protein
MTLHGRCHCGSVELTFEASVPAAELELRADQCSFCRRHGARTTSDPRGRVTIRIRGGTDPIRYRFGHRTADFLVCARCGIYVAAVMREEGGAWATVNVNTLEPSEAFAREAVPVSYEGETEAERRARRRARWTPAVVVEG